MTGGAYRFGHTLTLRASRVPRGAWEVLDMSDFEYSPMWLSQWRKTHVVATATNRRDAVRKAREYEEKLRRGET